MEEMSNNKYKIEKKLTSRFPKGSQVEKSDEWECKCGYLPFAHDENTHLYRNNEELIADFETKRQRHEEPPKFKKGIVLELKCKICGQSEKSEYYRFSYDEAGYDIAGWEPELIEEWGCPEHPGSETIETFSEVKK